MSIETEPILNIEQAKRYFIAMGCSHFHLDRENFQRRDEYYALKISADLEAEWRKEEVTRRLAEFPFDEPEKIGHSYHGLKDMIEDNADYLEQLLIIAERFYDILPLSQIQLVLSVIIGNNGTPTHGGLIEKAAKIGCFDLAHQFVSYAKKLIKKVDDNGLSLLGLRGYLVEVIKSLRLREEERYLQLLIERDNIESFKYYQKGAEKGNIFAMRMLAKHYMDGKGCEKDNLQAINWLTKAADLGNGLAKQELLELKIQIEAGR
ncbi:MAG TPA: tetratricopeptide repeat protein [Bacillota bacterium]|jgi:hypothetical protein|nr:tetratricopeptide repeat protein [Bacillota bacterium]HOL10796.1 tetratricopeptide repeat protein [Bacillota bacterium]HPO98252.1 tetratricopeptide repeat protein [Bacillota bacterium]